MRHTLSFNGEQVLHSCVGSLPPLACSFPRTSVQGSAT